MATTKRTRKPKASAASTAETAASTTTKKAAKAETATAVPITAKVTTRAVDLQGAIRFRAYELFEQRGHSHGYDLDDWLRAESEVLASFGARTA